MKTIEFYKSLPETLSKEEIHKLFKEIIMCFEKKEINNIDFLNIVTELMDRQVYTYELLPQLLRNELDAALSKIWNTKNYVEVDLMLTIIVSLGLEKSYDKVKKSLTEEKVDSDILSEIKETVEDIGQDVSNPYLGYDGN